MSNYKREKDDFYRSPDNVIKPLLDFQPKLRECHIWECAAGDGALVDQLDKEDMLVFASDLVDRGRAGFMHGIDFMTCRQTQAGAVITNPPNKLSEKFVRHSMKLGHEYTAILAPFKWLCAKGRTDLLPHLEGVLIMGRLRMLPPGVPDKGMTPMVDYAWLVFSEETSFFTNIERWQGCGLKKE